MSQTTDDSLEELQAFNEIVTALNKVIPNRKAHVWQTVGAFLGFGGQVDERPSRPMVEVRESPLSFSQDRTPTPKQFVLDKRPRTDLERVVVLAYYLTHYRAMATFKTLDVSTLNTEAAQRKFSNAGVAVENATKAGLLLAAGGGAKQISAVGEVYIRHLPDYDRAKAEVLNLTPNRRNKKKEKKK